MNSLVCFIFALRALFSTEKTVPRRYQMVLAWNPKEYKYFQWQVKHQLIIIMKRDGFLRSRANSYLLVRNGKRNRWAVPKRSIWPPEYCFPFCTLCITLYTGIFTWMALKFWHETFAYIRNYQKHYWENKANTEQGIVYEVRVETLVLLFHIILMTKRG